MLPLLLFILFPDQKVEVLFERYFLTNVPITIDYNDDDDDRQRLFNHKSVFYLIFSFFTNSCSQIWVFRLNLDCSISIFCILGGNLRAYMHSFKRIVVALMGMYFCKRECSFSLIILGVLLINRWLISLCPPESLHL